MNDKDPAIFFTSADNTHLFSKRIPFAEESGRSLIAVTMNQTLTFLIQADYRFIFPTITISAKDSAGIETGTALMN